MGSAAPNLHGGYLFHFNLTGNRPKVDVDNPRPEDPFAPISQTGSSDQLARSTPAARMRRREAHAEHGHGQAQRRSELSGPGAGSPNTWTKWASGDGWRRRHAAGENVGMDDRRRSESTGKGRRAAALA